MTYALMHSQTTFSLIIIDLFPSLLVMLASQFKFIVFKPVLSFIDFSFDNKLYSAKYEDEYQWVSPSAKGETYALCRWCMVDICIKSVGAKGLRDHEITGRHKQKASSHPSLPQLPTPAPPPQPPPPAQPPPSSATAHLTQYVTV